MPAQWPYVSLHGCVVGGGRSHLLLTMANKLLAASFGDFLDVFFSHPTDHVAARRWCVWKEGDLWLFIYLFLNAGEGQGRQEGESGAGRLPSGWR